VGLSDFVERHFVLVRGQRVEGKNLGALKLRYICLQTIISTKQVFSLMILSRYHILVQKSFSAMTCTFGSRSLVYFFEQLS
jgi:hypothetical protein